MVLCLCIFSCSYYLFVPLCRSWIFLEFGKKLWLLCASVRALEQHRSSTSGIWWLLIQADSSQDQNLLLLPTNALFWKCANEVHRIRSEVCGLKLSREVFKFWRKSLKFVEQLHSKGNRPSNSVYLACFSRVNWQQVNWTNSVDVLENMGLKKNFKNKFQNLLCPVDWIYLSKLEALISFEHVKSIRWSGCFSVLIMSPSWWGKTVQLQDRLFLI